MKYYLTALLLIFTIACACAQVDESNIDTGLFEKAKTDSSKASVYIEYSNTAYEHNPQNAIKYAIRAVDIAKKTEKEELIAESYTNLAILYYKSGNYHLATENLFKGLEYYQVSENQERIAFVYNRIGVIFFRQVNYVLALEYYNKSLKIREEIDDKKGVTNIYNNIGLLYQNQGLYKEALQYHMKGLKIKQEIDDVLGLAISNNNIGEIYRDLDSIDKALFHYNKSLELYSEINDKRGVAIVNMNLAQILKTKGKLNSALKLLDKSLEIVEETNDKFKMSEVLNYYGDCYLSAHQYKKAIIYYAQGYELGLEIGTPQITEHATYKLSESYAAINDFQTAYKLVLEYLKIKDSIKARQNIQQFTQKQMQRKFDGILKQKEFEEKEKEIFHDARIKRQNIILLAFSIGSILLIIVLVLLLRNNRIKQKTNKVLKQRNIEINQQKEEIQIQHGHLEKLNKELVNQKEEITNQRNNLERLNFELFEQKEQLEEEKKRSDKLIKNILPEAIASELVTSKRIKPRYYKHTTVMLTDFVGFTKLSKELSLLDLVNELDTYFAEFDGIIEKHNIEKIKTIGDSYLCVGGIPKENNSNPISTVLAGLEIQRFMERINRLQKKLKFPIWQIRIGIHTGEVFTGVVGKKKFAYEVLGETIYVASRIEDYCEAGNVTISETTYEHIKDYFECSFKQEIKLKYDLKQRIYNVESIKPEYSIKEEGKVPNNKLFKVIKEID